MTDKSDNPAGRLIGDIETSGRAVRYAFNTGLEDAARWHDECEKKCRHAADCCDRDVDGNSEDYWLDEAEHHRESAAVIRSRKMSAE